jgi:hypothetical protein
MLRALAASARPVGGWRAAWAVTGSARAFATDGGKAAATSGGGAVTPTDAGAGTGGESGSSSGAGGSNDQRETTDHGWSEVVDNASGKSYWWNQQTGQTTDLGASKPSERFWRRPAPAAGSGAGDDDGDDGGARGSGYDDSDPHFRDAQGVWREPPGRDKTWSYSVIGVGIGMAAGWLTQYIH